MPNKRIGLFIALFFLFNGLSNLCAQSLLSIWPTKYRAGTTHGVTAYSNDTYVPTFRATLSTELLDFSKKENKEDKSFPTASLGGSFCNKDFILNILVKVTENPEPLKENFGKFILAPTGTGDAFVNIDFAYILGGNSKHALRVYLSAINNEWVYAEKETNIEKKVGVDAYSIGVGYYRNLIRLDNEEGIDFSINLFGGLSIRAISGDIASMDYIDVRKSLLDGSTKTFFYGPEIYLDFVFNGFKAFANFTYLDSTITGLRNLKFTAGIGYYADILKLPK